MDWGCLVHPEAGGDTNRLVPMWFQMFYQFFMGNAAVFQDYIHTLFHFVVYVSYVYLIIKVVLIHELFRYRYDGDANPFESSRVDIELENLRVHARVPAGWCVYDTVSV